MIYVGARKSVLSSSGKSLAQQIAALFSAGEQGAWYDTSDMSTLFQDSAGTTPVTAVGQPVGLMLDKRLGLVRGAERWDYSAAVVGGESSVVSPGVFRIYSSAGAFSFAKNNGKLVIGATYEVTFTIDSVTTAGAGVGPDAVASPGFTTVGVKRAIVVANSADALIKRNSTATDIQVSNISFRELPGNHATQPTAINRPVLSARVNVLTKTGNLEDAQWGFVGGTKTVGETDPLGGTTACKLTGPTTGTPALSGVIAPATAVTYSVYVKWVAGIELRSFLLRNGTTATNFDSVSINIRTGTIAVGGVNWTITPAENGFFKVSYTRTLGISTGDTLVIYYGGTGGVVDSGSWTIAFPQVEAGVVPTRYQRVNTPTEYDTVGFPHYLTFNGTNSWMSTAAINFTTTDKMMVVVGVRKSNDSSTGAIVELSSGYGGNPGSFLLNTTGAGLPAYSVALRGTTNAHRQIAPFAAPASNVITLDMNISLNAGQEIQARVNTSVPAVSVSGDAGTGTYGNYPLYIGARAGANLFFNGRLYGLIIRGAQSNASQIISAEKFANSKTGVY